MTPRQRLALGALAVLAGAMALGAPGVGRAATVSCPELSLLSEELAESPSVFVGVMQAPLDTDVGRGATFVVEETWRGPDLAPVVRVTVEDSAGAPTLELARGVRYLVAANPSPEAMSAGPITTLLVPACSVTRPWAPELADLRPPDARPMEGAAPTPTTARAPVPGWLWAGSGVLLLVAIGLALVGVFRRRALLRPAAMTGVGGVALLGAAIALSLSPSAPDVGPSASAGARTPRPSEASLPTDGRLVARLELLRDETRVSVVSIHADGRLISASSETATGNLSERRLSADGVRLVLQAMETAGLPDGDTPGTLGRDVANGEIIERLTYAAANGTVRSVRWTAIDPGDADGSADAAAIERLEALAQQLLTPEAWLPAAAWVTAERSDYRAETFHVLVSPIAFGSARPAIDASDLPAPFPASLDALDATAAIPGCVPLARSQATQLLAAIAEQLDRIDLRPAAASTDIAVDDAERSVTYRLSLRPVLPDEGGCPQQPSAEPPATELAAGAIALVRVDALRVRSGAGSSFEAIDSFAAGERVEVLAGPVAADGMDWYEVRQGPSGRGGHVAVGPADGDPWLVPVSNGTIAFMGGVGQDGTHSVGLMNADGSGVVTLVDGGGPVWSPDGQRLAFTAPQPDGTWQLATARSDGSQVTPLGEGEYPAWSPDGARLAFGRGDEIWMMNADGTEQRLLVGGASPWSVAWDPDGSRLAYMAPEVTETGGEGIMAPNPEALWFFDIATGEATRMTPADVFDNAGTTPAWSPDGTRLAIGGNRLIDESGAVVLQLELGVTWALAPWSPRGDELALFVDGSIEILDLESGERRTVARAGTANQLIWSPDGSHLAFTAGSAGSDGWQIRVLDAAAGDPVGMGPPFGQSPAWQPVVSHGLD